LVHDKIQIIKLKPTVLLSNFGTLSKTRHYPYLIDQGTRTGNQEKRRKKDKEPKTQA
jgi:hypothetical protein